MKIIKIVIEGTYLMGYNEKNEACCYYPLTEEAKELDLPWLPNPFKDKVDVEKLACAKYNVKNGIRDYDERYYNTINVAKAEAFIEGYNAAQSSNKQFSLEDIKEAFRAGRKHGEDNACSAEINLSPSEEDYIQTLSTQQLPKEFIPEYEFGGVKSGYTIYHKIGENNILKTITNSEGKEVVQGEWIY